MDLQSSNEAAGGYLSEEVEISLSKEVRGEKSAMALAGDGAGAVGKVACYKRS